MQRVHADPPDAVAASLSDRFPVTVVHTDAIHAQVLAFGRALFVTESRSGLAEECGNQPAVGAESSR